jgi:hypothetical protein
MPRGVKHSYERCGRAESFSGESGSAIGWPHARLMSDTLSGVIWNQEEWSLTAKRSEVVNNLARRHTGCGVRYGLLETIGLRL